jgi:hypothetical protein
MTKLTYLVGKEEITTYPEAIARANQLGVKPVPKYTQVAENPPVSAEYRAKRVSAIKAEKRGK